MVKYIKIELLSLAMILLMLAISYLVKVKNETATYNTFSKEIEIFDSITKEVNGTDVTSLLYSDYSVRQKGDLVLTKVKYRGNSAKELTAESGHTINKMFYLDKNVNLLQENGYRYKAEHALYDQNINFFYVTSPFTGYINDSVIKGSNLKYDVDNKIATAHNINAVFYTGKER